MGAVLRATRKPTSRSSHPPFFINDVLSNDRFDISINAQHFVNLFSSLEAMYAGEPSRVRAAITLGTIGLNNANPSVDTLHNLNKDLGDAILAARKAFTPSIPRLVKFPTYSSLLTNERLVHAYGVVRPMKPPERCGPPHSANHACGLYPLNSRGRCPLG